MSVDGSERKGKDDFRYRPEFLEGANNEEILKLVEMLLNQEMHFNRLCAEFKKMASIWLLSTFAGVGFVLANNVSGATGLGTWTMIGLIAGGGSIGIVVLWLADLQVYQRLLSAAFYWRGAIEYKANWLPPIHSTMHDNIFGNRVGFTLALIYVAPFFATSYLAVLGIYIGSLRPNLEPASANLLGLAAVLGITILAVVLYKASVPGDGFNRMDARLDLGVTR